MSIHILSKVWKWKAPDVHTKIVMLKLADNANDEAESWPSLKRIAAEGCLSRATVCDRLNWLEAQGIISRRPGGPRPGRLYGETTKYRIHCGKLPAMSSGQGSDEEGSLCGDEVVRAAREVVRAAREVVRGTDTNRHRTVIEPSLAAAEPQRVRDECFEALIELSGCEPSEVTKDMRGSVNRALKSIREVTPDLSPAEIQRRAAAYRSLYPKATLTATALAKHWPVLGQKKEESGGRAPSPYEVPPCNAWKGIARALARRMNWDASVIDDELNWQDLAGEHRLAIWAEFKNPKQEAA